jgi:hypothetical protein
MNSKKIFQSAKTCEGHDGHYDDDDDDQFYKIGVENLISWAQRQTISQNIQALNELI